MKKRIHWIEGAGRKGEWVGLARLKRRDLAALVSPDTRKRRPSFTLSFPLKPEGFDTGDADHFDTPEAAKAYAEQRFKEACT
jgi:hypothetical protein